MPYTPKVTIAADISAETWLGASGWARGSQACSGRMPAFEANPIKVSANTSPAVVGESVVAATRNAGNESLSACPVSTSSPIRMATNPRWVITAYQRAADATSARWLCSASTSSSEVSAISSQHTRNVPTLPAAGTSSMAATNSGSVACTQRPSRPWRAYPIP